MPAEWAPHDRCWIAWPCREEIWGARFDDAKRSYAEIAQAIAEFEPVTILASSKNIADASLTLGAGMSVVPMPQDDSWVRDFGPSFVIDKDTVLGGVCWRFNGWGEVSRDYSQSAQTARRICARLEVAAIESTLTLEGGAVHVDGAGTAIVCAPSVLDPERNPGLSRTDVERELARTIGAEQVLWLEGTLADDMTKGHVDNVACFSAAGTVLTLDPETAADNDRPGLEANLDTLRSAKDAAGRSLEVIKLPLPRPRTGDDGRRLTASYMNFYIANGGVVMPSFGDAADSQAKRILAQAFPDRTVIDIDAEAIVQGGGGIHCITQQQPTHGKSLAKNPNFTAAAVTSGVVSNVPSSFI